MDQCAYQESLYPDGPIYRCVLDRDHTSEHECPADSMATFTAVRLDRLQRRITRLENGVATALTFLELGNNATAQTILGALLYEEHLTGRAPAAGE